MQAESNIPGGRWSLARWGNLKLMRDDPKKSSPPFGFCVFKKDTWKAAVVFLRLSGAAREYSLSFSLGSPAFAISSWFELVLNLYHLWIDKMPSEKSQVDFNPMSRASKQTSGSKYQEIHEEKF